MLSGQSVTGAYRKVFQFVSEAPVSVLGYTTARALVFVLGVIVPVGLVGGALSAVDAGGGVSAIVTGLVALVALPVVSAYLYVYHVAYYQRRHRTSIG